MKEYLQVLNDLWKTKPTAFKAVIGGFLLMFSGQYIAINVPVNITAVIGPAILVLIGIWLVAFGLIKLVANLIRKPKSKPEAN